jgi:hypothetical protein
MTIDAVMAITTGEVHQLGSGTTYSIEDELIGFGLHNRLSLDISPVTIFLKFIPGVIRQPPPTANLDHLD